MEPTQESRIFSFRITADEKKKLEKIARELRKQTGDYASASTVARMALKHGIPAICQAAGIEL